MSIMLPLTYNQDRGESTGEPMEDLKNGEEFSDIFKVDRNHAHNTPKVSYYKANHSSSL